MNLIHGTSICFFCRLENRWKYICKEYVKPSTKTKENLLFISLLRTILLTLITILKYSNS